MSYTLKTPFDQDIIGTKAKLADLTAQQREHVSNMRITCIRCKKTSRAKDWTWLQTWWYDDDPYNPDWIPHKDSNCEVRCPKCEEHIRFCWMNNKEAEKILAIAAYSRWPRIFKEEDKRVR